MVFVFFKLNILFSKKLVTDILKLTFTLILANCLNVIVFLLKESGFSIKKKTKQEYRCQYAVLERGRLQFV